MYILRGQVKKILSYINSICILVHRQIGLCLARVYRVMNARGKFGEQERSVKVTRDTTESNYDFLGPNLYTKNYTF